MYDLLSDVVTHGDYAIGGGAGARGEHKMENRTESAEKRATAGGFCRFFEAT